jgi:hypothetical protein
MASDAKSGEGGGLKNFRRLLGDSEGAGVFLLIGKSFRGKSHFAQYLIRAMCSHPDPAKRWRWGILFAGTLYSGAYDWLPKAARYEGYSEPRLEAYLGRLKTAFRKMKALPPSFIWFDDVQGVLQQETPAFQNFLCTARHLGVAIVICSQYLNRGISTTLRAQTTHVLMWKAKQQRTLEMLWKDFGQLFPSFEAFAAYLAAATKEKFVAVLYVDRVDEVDSNYELVRAPAELPKTRLAFQGGA